MASSEVEVAFAEYERVLRELSAMQEASLVPPPRKWNRLFAKLDKPGRVLRDSEQGRALISGLMHDPSVTVQSSAAAAALFWDEPEARRVLEEIRDRGLPLRSLNAKYILIEFDRGHLSNLRPDWYEG